MVLQSDSTLNPDQAGSYLRLIDSCITQLKAQETSRTCNESNDEEKKNPDPPSPNGSCPTVG